MRIDWKTRIKNKVFWITLIPAVILLIQAVCGLFGFVIDLSDIQGKIITVVNALFVVLALFGIVVDPKTEGLSD